MLTTWKRTLGDSRRETSLANNRDRTQKEQENLRCGLQPCATSAKLKQGDKAKRTTAIYHLTFLSTRYITPDCKRALARGRWNSNTGNRCPQMPVRSPQSVLELWRLKCLG